MMSERSKCDCIDTRKASRISSRESLESICEGFKERKLPGTGAGREAFG